MIRTHAMPGGRVVALWAAVLFALSMLLPLALADEEYSSLGSSPVVDAIPSEFQQRVEETSAAYNEAVERRAKLEEQAASCQVRIDELEAQLPAAQERAAVAIRSQYKYQQGTNELLSLLFSADGFEQFVATLQYFESVSRLNNDQIAELLDLQEELAQQQAELDAALEDAQAQEEAAQEALAEAQAARAEAQRKAEEEARRRAEEEAARQQQAAAEAAAAAENTPGEVAPDNTGSQAEDAGQATTPSDDDGGTEGTEPPADEPAESVDWMSDRDIFINDWGARIDAYLGGSALGGYGRTFAAAAWDYGVDPRWSPAIAFAESSLGAYCFRPHNAWGWGSVSWDSWEDAIYGHVAGLARGYGYTLTYDAALKYCPPNADHWYNTVATQMALI